jgi:Raf kinase inhibitor-like YbhB/YbcL family protein
MLFTKTAGLLFALSVALAACHSRSARGGEAMNLGISSDSFAFGGTIPVKFTCDGQDRSPELHWGESPAETRSFALIADDPDAPAGTWVHWVIFNLPPQTKSLPEDVVKKGELDSGALQGTNDFGNLGYGGPCPPPGKAHRYFFKLYALDTALSLQAGAKKADVERAMKGHILAQGELMGHYAR